MKIGFVTCAAEKLPYFFPTRAEPNFIPHEPPFTPDDEIAAKALRASGHHVEPIVWNSPIHTLKNFDLIIVRSPWDYMDDKESAKTFMEWLEALENANLQIANPVNLMQWLLDKHYLQHFEQHGIAVIPTRYYEKGSTINLVEQFKLKNQFVLKPCISAGGKGLYHVKSREDANTYQQEMNLKLQNNSYMLQDFIPEIMTNGEWSLIYLGGKYSHALHKKPAADSILVHAERGGTLSFSQQPNQTILGFAELVYEKLFAVFKSATGAEVDPKFILYLRLDIIETKNGPRLIECEGVEPELFFRAKKGSEEAFCRAINSLKI